MITNKQRTLIKETWSDIEYHLDNIDWTHYAKNMLEVCLEESKRHDRFRSDGIFRGLTVLEEAKYFAIKRLWEYRNGQEHLKIEHYLMTQKSCFNAACIMTSDRFKEAREKILKLRSEDMETIALWDYCDLIHAEKLSPGYTLDSRRGFKRSPVSKEA
jgi:hypothetical protein